MMEEIWRTTPQLNGFYEVSNLGKIRRVTGWSAGRLLTGRSITHNGYERTIVHIAGKAISLNVARVICEAFHGVAPKGTEVNHKNFDKRCNHSSNLEWVTRSDNTKHAYRAGRTSLVAGTVHEGENNGSAKLTEAQVREMKEMFRLRSKTSKEIAQYYGVSLSAINDIRQGRYWRHV